MNVVEKFGIPEPQWILERAECGSMFWRRDPKTTPTKSRVKFRVDVEVKEFSRGEHELEEDCCWPDNNGQTNILTMGMTCLICVTFTVLLPWYVLIGSN